MDFIAQCSSTKEVLKTANLVTNLNISSLIIGQRGTGRKLLAKMILPNAPVVNGSNTKELSEIIIRSDEIIIEDFNKVSNFDNLDFSDKKIVAISTHNISKNIVDKFFGITMELLPLSQRHEDAIAIAEIFLNEAKKTFFVDKEISIKDIELDLSQNAHSLKRSVYITILMDSIGENDILRIMEKYLEDKLVGVNAYRDNLYLFDEPIIKSGLEKYGSQLKLSEVLGLNRNTLRKKVYELGIRT